MRKRSVRSVASLALWTELRYCTTPIVARIEINAMTMSSSMSVKPRARRIVSFIFVPALSELPFTRVEGSPVAVLGSVEPRSLCLGVDVVDVAAAPRRGVRFVAVRSQSPVSSLRHRVLRNAAKEFQLSAGRVVRHGDAFNERLEVRRISLAADLDVHRSDESVVD